MQPEPAVQTKDKRIRNFQEVSLGYPKRLALDEARRCPQCQDATCLSGCPLGVDIPGFLRRLREGDTEGAYAIVRASNPMPAICGRICPAPCEPACVLNATEHAPIGIRHLERYVSDHGRHKLARPKISPMKTRVAIVGSGPAGLMAAYELALKGHRVTIFETLDKPGGMLRFAIPEFRLPKKILDEEIQNILDLGVEVKLNSLVGQTVLLEDLRREGYQAVLLAMGSGVPRFLEIPGANLNGVYYGEEFLLQINTRKASAIALPNDHFKVGQRVTVIGSGNTALDSARSARRMGAKVCLAFVRDEARMRVDPSELALAKEEGVELIPFVRPIEICGNESGDVEAVKLLKVKEDDLTPLSGDKSGLLVETDTVVIAIGHHPNVWIKSFVPGLVLNADQSIKVDGRGMTSVDGVFAAGNVVLNGGSAVYAMAAGREVALDIDAYLK